MVERLTNEETIRNAALRIRELMDEHPEWLYAEGAHSVATCLRKSELDFRVAQGRLIFSCLSAGGLAVWRIAGWEWTGEKLLFVASRRAGVESAHLELVPRASVKLLTAAVSTARRERCRRLAALACSTLRGAKVERAGLSEGGRRDQPGRYARILLCCVGRERVAVAGLIDEFNAGGVDRFLSSTLIWFMRTSERRTRPPYIRKLWLVVGKDSVEPLGRLVALLRSELRDRIRIYRLEDEERALTPVDVPELGALWRTRPGPLRRPPPDSISESAESIIALAPEAIDVVRARHGETLRYRGLGFARVRRVMGRAQVWFGATGTRRVLLDESTLEEWEKLVRDLQEHRRADCPDRRNALYRAAPEAWLESELRRDITRLDPGLRLAPLYAQFRPAPASGLASRPIDLLALRCDGRLAVIELKASEDREHVFQGADYWLRTETFRRHGHLQRARLFSDAVISDEPPLVYLVAPLLSFHRAFHELARTLTPAIEIYRFDLNEDWRTGIRVSRRVAV